MPDIATALKEEIARIARREIRADSLALKNASASYRSEIAALKRRIHDLEQQLRRHDPARVKKTTATAVPKAPAKRHLRFRVGGLITLRKRLGLSAAEMGTLLGVSGQSIYHWEAGKAKPRASQLSAIAALRGIGKREAAARLAELAAQAN